MEAALLYFLTVVPNWSQFFEYEQFSVSCGASDQWTVWRYTTKSLQLSQCGSGWGSRTSSTCHIKTVKLLASGVYWCQSQHGLSSNAVNVTVTAGPVVLLSPVVPVTEGDNVTLSCKTKATPPNRTAAFYKDDSLIGTGPTGHMTIHHFSRSHQGAYKCLISGVGESPPSWLSVTDESDPVSLRTSPDSSQLTEYEVLSLSCGDNSSSRGWSIRRFTVSSLVLSTCGDDWGFPSSSGCVLQTTKQPDSAVYWCESVSRQRSNSFNLSVHGGPVVLQSPILPVMAGDNVTLRCKAKATPLNRPAAFYKDDSLIGTGPTGHMTIHHVSWSHQGAYKCHISGEGESPPSWLFVSDSAGSAPEATAPVFTMMRCVVVCFPYILSTVLMASRYPRMDKHGERAPSGSMTTPPPGEEDGDGEYDDVTTEHHF